MAILKVARLGHPVVRQAAKEVTPEDLKSAQTQKLIDDMIETMREYEGVGIAAPQVHVSKQIAVIEVNASKRYPNMPQVPLTIIVNPRITVKSEEKNDSWEGCLSIPDLRGVVPRASHVVCEALDREGNPIKIEAKGFTARVFQHEVDHLRGKVYIDAMTDLNSLTHLEEFARYWAPNNGGRSS